MLGRSDPAQMVREVCRRHEILSEAMSLGLSPGFLIRGVLW